MKFSRTELLSPIADPVVVADVARGLNHHRAIASLMRGPIIYRKDTTRRWSATHPSAQVVGRDADKYRVVYSRDDTGELVVRTALRAEPRRKADAPIAPVAPPMSERERERIARWQRRRKAVLDARRAIAESRNAQIRAEMREANGL